jgi:hypothetical protein
LRRTTLVTKAKTEPGLKNLPRIHRKVKEALKVISPASYFEQAKRTFFDSSEESVGEFRLGQLAK